MALPGAIVEILDKKIAESQGDRASGESEGEGESASGMSGEEAESMANEVLSAMSAKDPKALALALKAFCEACMMASDDDGEDAYDEDD